MPKGVPKAAELEKEQERILKEEKKIEDETKELLEVSTEVKKLVRADIQIDKQEEKLEEKEATDIQRFAIHNLKHHKIILTFVIFIAVILVWRGVWTIMDGISIFTYTSTSIIALVVGIGVLWLLKKFDRL